MCGVRVACDCGRQNTGSFLVVQVKILNILCRRPFVFSGPKYKLSFYGILNLHCN